MSEQYPSGFQSESVCGLTEGETAGLRAHQAACMEALRFLQELSEKHGLRYCLIAGSALGAVRHKGFIPWDDDIDVGVRAEDREKLEDCIRAELPPKFTFEEALPDRPYPRMFSKICHDGRCCIDLFPLAPSTPRAAARQWRLGKMYRKLHNRKLRYVAENEKLLLFSRVLAAFVTDRQVMALAHRNENRFAHRDAPLYINLYSIYSREKETVPTQWLEQTAMMDFGGVTVPVIGCTDAYLKHVYGDYWELPPPSERVSQQHLMTFR